MLQDNINQTVSVHTEEGEERGPGEQKPIQGGFKGASVLSAQSRALGYHSVLRGRKLNWSWQKGFY